MVFIWFSSGFKAVSDQIGFGVVGSRVVASGSAHGRACALSAVHSPYTLPIPRPQWHAISAATGPSYSSHGGQYNTTQATTFNCNQTPTFHPLLTIRRAHIAAAHHLTTSHSPYTFAAFLAAAAHTQNHYTLRLALHFSTCNTFSLSNGYGIFGIFTTPLHTTCQVSVPLHCLQGCFGDRV